jgi:hypothetical protein
MSWLKPCEGRKWISKALVGQTEDKKPRVQSSRNRKYRGPLWQSPLGLGTGSLQGCPQTWPSPMRGKATRGSSSHAEAWTIYAVPQHHQQEFPKW